MPEFTSIQVQSMLRQMDVSMRKHRKLKKENHAKYVEKIQEENKVLRVIEPIPPGKNVGKIGEDVKIGQELLIAGRKLRPQDIGILSSIGTPSVSVIKKPTVDIFITGDELLKPGSMPKGYQIVDSNSVMLDALVYRDIQINPNIIFCGFIDHIVK